MSSLNGAVIFWLVALFAYKCTVYGHTFPPAILSINGNGVADSSYYMLLETWDFTFTCQADRPDGHTSIQWRKTNSPTLPAAWKYSRQGENASITLLRSEAMREPENYEGTYECVVNNKAGTAVSTPVMLKIAEIRARQVIDSAKIPAARVVMARRGSTANMTCNSSSEMTFSPDRPSLSLTFKWFLLNTTSSITSSIASVDPELDPRFILDEYGTLYIRQVTASDSRLLPSIYECFVRGDYLFPRKIGAYVLNVLDTEERPSETRLIRRTPDVTVRAGSTLYLSCVFESPENAYEEVTWDKPFTKAYSKGSLIEIADVSALHEGSWQCKYNDVSAAISVTVLQQPEITGLADTYATVNDDVRLNCLSSTSSTFKWFINNDDIERSTRHEFESTPASSSLTIRKVTKADEGVIRCAATSHQNVTVCRNVRLIVVDKAKVDDVKAVHSGRENFGDDLGSYAVTNQTTQILFTCNYSIDSRITDARVTWRLENFNGDIDEQTHEEGFGLQRPAVRTSSERRESTLAINYTPDSAGKMFGRVNCTLVYKLLDRTFAVHSGKVGQLYAAQGSQISMVSNESRFPYWIIIAVLASALLIATVAALIVRHMHRNKGEQYHVEKKEQKAGYDPKNALPPWRDFIRPDSEPTTDGSRQLTNAEEDVGDEMSV